MGPHTLGPAANLAATALRSLASSEAERQAGTRNSRGSLASNHNGAEPQ